MKLLRLLLAGLLLLALAGIAHARVNARTQALTTSYIGTDLTSTAGTRVIELGCLDAGALVACTLRVTDEESDQVEFPIAASNVWTMDFGQRRGAGFLSFDVKAAAGTPTLQILEY